MKLSKIATLLLAATVAFTSVESIAAVKKIKTKSSLVKTAKKNVKKSTVLKNSTKSLYGVKGAKLQPTKISVAKYSYREKGKVHHTIGKEASRQYGQVGVASYYGGMFNGRKTANGEIFNENHYTAAHKTLALGSYALVTNLRNGRKIIVKINDRGPFSKDRIIDLSKGAAREIGMIHSGVARVRVEALHVDKQGYISGKGATSLYKLAKREGLPLKVKNGNGDIAFKADESPKTMQVQHTQERVKPTGQAVKKGEKKAKNTVQRIVGPKLNVVTGSEKEAKRLAAQVKQKAVVEKTNKGYRVVISVANQAESGKLQKQVKKLAHYQSINYSAK